MDSRNKNHVRYQKLMHQEFTFQDWGNSWPVSLHIGILAKDRITRKNVLRKSRRKTRLGPRKRLRKNDVDDPPGRGGRRLGDCNR